MKDSNILVFVYSILNDKLVAEKFMHTRVKDSKTMEVIGLDEARLLVERLYEKVLEVERENDAR